MYYCDCCIPDLHTMCESMFSIYIAILLTYIVALLTYLVLKSNTQRLKKQQTHQNKRWIVILICIWIFFRIGYWATFFYQEGPKSDNHEAFKCTVELTQNLPVYSMDICIIVVHQFIMKLYVHFKYQPDEIRKK